MCESFCDRLKKLRGSVSQTKFAQMLGVKQGTYSTWELGKYQPPMEMLTKIASFSGKSIDWLLGRETVGDRIRMAREAMGMNIPELSDALGKLHPNMRLEPSYYTRLENGVEPSSGVLHYIAKFFGVSEAQLNGDEPMRKGRPPGGSAAHAPVAGCPNCERLMAIVESQMRTIESLARRDVPAQVPCPAQRPARRVHAPQN